MSIAKKIAEVTENVRMPAKTGSNKHLGYDYSTRDDIFAVIRKELSARGVSVLPSVVRVERTETGAKTRSGSPTQRVAVEVEITMVSEEGSHTQTWHGEAHTHDDKGVQQAVTQALRFWAVNTFMLLDGSDEQIAGSYPAPAGSPASASNVHSARPAPQGAGDLIQKVISRLKELQFSEQQVTAFGRFCAQKEQVSALKEVPVARLAKYMATLQGADDQVRKRVLKAIKQVE